MNVAEIFSMFDLAWLISSAVLLHMEVYFPSNKPYTLWTPKHKDKMSPESLRED